MTAPTPNTRFARRATTIVVGALLVLLAAQPVLAVEWGSPVQLSSQENYQPRLFRTGPAKALMVWQHGSSAYARRSTNNGTTWSSPITIASGIRLNFAASANGSSVDIAYVHQTKSPTGGNAYRLYYRRSLDGGATWEDPRPLTSSSSNILDQALARHANGRVSVAWTGYSTGRLYMRTSADNGTTFGPARYIGSTSNWEPGTYPFYRSEPAIAIGTGVTYVAYLSAANTMSVRRTIDQGVTWSSPTKISGSTSEGYTIVATGGSALLAYTSTASGTMQTVYRRTTNKGTTWSTAKAFSASSNGRFSTSAQLVLRAGVIAVAFKHGRPGDSPIWYRQSTDFGLTWSPLSRVSVETVEDSDPDVGGVAILDTVRLVGWNENRGPGAEGLWIRQGH
jgi:hypothetical protein